MQFSNINEKQN